MPLPEQLNCWATTAPGVEQLLGNELRGLGITPGADEPGGVKFNATTAQLADALLHLRTASRVVVRMATFRAQSFGELERRATGVPWDWVLVPGRAVHFRVSSKKSRLYHEDGIAERLERAVHAVLPGAELVRAPSAAEAREDDVTRVADVQRIVVRVMRDEFTLSADAAGALLHLRGWRQAVAKAPLRETLAATLLLASGWDRRSPLIDPFCGSGTIVIEAALMARGMAPGRGRRFAMEAWSAACAAAMAAARLRARNAEHASPAICCGADRDAGAIAASIANAERAGVSESVRFEAAALSHLAADDAPGWIVTNPPYGARIGERHDLRDLYAVLGRMLRERRPASHFAMLSADRMLEGQLGVPLEEVLRTTNGGLPVRVVRRAL